MSMSLCLAGGVAAALDAVKGCEGEWACSTNDCCSICGCVACRGVLGCENPGCVAGYREKGVAVLLLIRAGSYETLDGGCGGCIKFTRETDAAVVAGEPMVAAVDVSPVLWFAE